MPRTAIQDAEHRAEEQALTLRAMHPDAGLPRDALAAAAFSRRALSAVLATPCTRHHARAGQPCWPVVSGADPTGRTTYPAACGQRVAMVITAPPPPRRWATPGAKTLRGATPGAFGSPDKPHDRQAEHRQEAR